MTVLKRGMVIDVNLNPTKGSETGKVSRLYLLQVGVKRKIVLKPILK
jgi:hypothetical protein